VELQPYQERVVEEKKELDEKLGALNAFISDSRFFTLFHDEQVRLKKQFKLMTEYSAVLKDRIEAFRPLPEPPEA